VGREDGPVAQVKAVIKENFPTAIEDDTVAGTKGGGLNMAGGRGGRGRGMRVRPMVAPPALSAFSFA
jgi:hypothetical protein